MAKRVIDTEFWTDDKVVEMFSPEDKLFFLYLMTNPHTTQLGIYHINKRVIAFEIGYSLEAVSVLIDRFENKYGLIKYSESTSEVAIKNFLKHSIVKGGKPVEDLLKREINKVKDKSLLSYVFENLSDVDNLNSSVKEILPFINNDNENVNVNVNAVSLNDSYDDSYNDSCDDSSKHSKKVRNKIPPTVEEVKEYCLERGNNVDAETFVDFYESKGWLVGKNKMKDWKAAVRTWERNQKGKSQGRLDWIRGVEL